MPLQFWTQAAALGLRIVEYPVPLLYLEEKRSFGGSLDDGQRRLAYYRTVLDREIEAVGFCSSAAGRGGHRDVRGFNPAFLQHSRGMAARSEWPSVCRQLNQPGRATGYGPRARISACFSTLRCPRRSKAAEANHASLSGLEVKLSGRTVAQMRSWTTAKRPSRRPANTRPPLLPPRTRAAPGRRAATGDRSRHDRVGAVVCRRASAGPVSSRRLGEEFRDPRDGVANGRTLAQSLGRYRRDGLQPHSRSDRRAGRPADRARCLRRRSAAQPLGRK